MKVFNRYNYMVWRTIGTFRFALKPFHFARRKISNFLFHRKQLVDWQSYLDKSQGDYFHVEGDRWLGHEHYKNTPIYLKERENILADALSLRDGWHLANGRWIKISGDDSGLNWDTDPISKKRWPASTINEPLSMIADIRYPWDLGRWHFLITYGQAYFLSKDEAWIRYAVRDMDSCLSCRPLFLGVHWRDGLQIAIRMFSIFGFCELIRDSKIELPKCYLSIHYNYLKRNISSVSEITNNHRLVELCSLLSASVLLKLHSDTSLHLGKLSDELKRQINDDGLTYEGTIPYNRFNLEALLVTYKICKANGFESINALDVFMRKMSSALSQVATNDYWLPPIGDGDDASVLRLSNDPYLSVKSLLACTSQPTGDRIGNVLPTLYSSWFTETEKDPKPIDQKTSPSLRVANFSDTGVYALHLGAYSFWVDYGYTGLGKNGPGGHGHNDTCSIALYKGNIGILHDPGWYTYHGDKEMRNELRGTRAHNNCVVNELEQAELGGLFEIANECKPTKIRIRDSASRLSILVGHNGYERINPKVKYRRYIHISKTDLRSFVMTDRLVSTSRFAARSYFGSDLRMQPGSDGLIFFGSELRGRSLTDAQFVYPYEKPFSRENNKLLTGSGVFIQHSVRQKSKCTACFSSKTRVEMRPF